MIIKFSPVRSDAAFSLARLGDTLTINGLALDFAKLPDGGTLPAGAIASPDVLGPVERRAGKLVITLCLPHGADAPEVARFPADILDPPAGMVQVPGIEQGPQTPAATGVIDWSQLVTAEDKSQAEAELLRVTVTAEIASRRAVADTAIAPLQDAVDLGEATQAESAALVAWKRYRVALNRLHEQPGYPITIDWPAAPA